MRKIRATLRKPGDNLGHVKVAVHTYAYLLAKSADESSSYGPTFFLKELLTGPDAVVRLTCQHGVGILSTRLHTALCHTAELGFCEAQQAVCWQGGPAQQY